MLKKYINMKQHFLLLSYPTDLCDVTCSKLQRYRENIGDKKLLEEANMLSLYFITFFIQTVMILF